MSRHAASVVLLFIGCGEVAADGGGQPDAASQFDTGADVAIEAETSADGARPDAARVCNAPTPEEACEDPACRDVLVKDCWIATTPAQTTCSCLLGDDFQECSGEGDPDCPTGTRCVWFKTLFCHPQYGKTQPFCSTTTHEVQVCWPE